MSKFSELLQASSENLLKLLYRSSANKEKTGGKNRAQAVATHLGVTYEQLVCALGFNKRVRDLPDITALLGFTSYDQLAAARNEIFIDDIYNKLGIKDVLAIYVRVTDDLHLLEIMQHLLRSRLNNIESRIEETVNSMVIERYKKEMRAIYNDGVAQIDFAEERLSHTHSGFRALLNEVSMIVESKLLPVGDVFFRDTVLPEEKRRLIIKRLIPKNLVEARLEDEHISDQERKVLLEQLSVLDA